MSGSSTPKGTSASTHVLILGTADWNQAIATNQHYIARELAKQRGVSVTFVESLGLRAPEFSAADAGRIARRVRAVVTRRGAAGVSRAVPDGVSVASPLVAPASWRVAHPANGAVLRRSVRGWLQGAGTRILWTYTPVTYGLEAHADATVYHCVDLLGQVAGIDPELIDEGEVSLAKAGATSVASSEVVRTHLEERGFADSILWENVADTQVFSAALTSAPARVARRAIFAGNLTPEKVDYSALHALTRAGWQVMLAGPRGHGDGKEFARALGAGVQYLGMLAPAELAQEFARATVGLIPYIVSPYTRGVSPLKTFEYLGTGLAVVASDLPGVRRVPGMVELASGPQGFVAAAEQFSEVPSPQRIAARVAIAQEHSWQGRGEQAREMVTTLAALSQERGARP
ncbi:glycosyltransferase [Demequina aurantiaca]|uniref:glycosyltransferase n=1 Tax=Demequina aurantiaca TaxID=676200 RepID=UPI003D351056